jgi:hypothetical protein
MMQAVVALLPLQRAFPTESQYLTYCEDYVGACLSALAVAVGRDLLWKPLNHKVLMLTRDSKKAVRIAAVKTLHRLFSEVSLHLSSWVVFDSSAVVDVHEVTSGTALCYCHGMPCLVLLLLAL